MPQRSEQERIEHLNQRLAEVRAELARRSTTDEAAWLRQEIVRICGLHPMPQTDAGLVRAVEASLAPMVKAAERQRLHLVVRAALAFAAGCDVVRSAEPRSLAGAIVARRERGLCTLKQARQLAKYGLDPDMPFATARAVLDRIAANRWQLPPDIDTVVVAGGKA